MPGYVSTRGQAPRLGFADAALAGLAADGGLYVPEAWPQLTAEDLANMAHQPYLEVAWRVIQPFAGEDIPSADLLRLLKAAYATFSHRDIAPLRQLDENFYLLELFHGPTLAFKDVALQFLGQVFSYILERRRQRVTIIGATSGDTGSAAIAAFRDKPGVTVFILHPKGRVSEVQRRQMTTVQSANVFNIAIAGTFDDCQDLVKAMFNDQKFREELSLSAVNSINWARIVAQSVYYVFAAARLGRPAAFCVPTGNFGNIYAAYAARAMGAPAEKLIVATNRNDILHRFFDSGEMSIGPVAPTLSPSMDIQVSSNFERLLFDLCGRSGFAVAQTMRHFRESGAFRLAPELMAQVRGLFASGRLDDAGTLEVMRRIWQQKNHLLDPHTAVGVGVAEAWRRQNPKIPVVALATAHPAKFPEAVQQAVGFRPALPPELADLHERPEKCADLPADLAAVQRFVRERAK